LEAHLLKTISGSPLIEVKYFIQWSYTVCSS